MERNARFALQQGIFRTPEELNAALLTLRDNDPPYAETARGITGEHAMTMDATQWPLRHSETGALEVDPDRLNQYYGMVHGGSPNLLERIWMMSLSPDDFLEAAQNIDSFYRKLKPMWETGYPVVRSEDVAVLSSEALRNANQITRILLPSLSRAYLIMNRTEASRRATQLTYGIHLFKARYGRWPNSLDELPPELDPEARTDPFSGADFAYWLNDDGTFTLYSTADNGQDDGGFHNPDRDIDPNINSDDIVYWPPK